MVLSGRRLTDLLRGTKPSFPLRMPSCPGGRADQGLVYAGERTEYWSVFIASAPPTAQVASITYRNSHSSHNLKELFLNRSVGVDFFFYLFQPLGIIVDDSG